MANRTIVILTLFLWCGSAWAEGKEYPKCKNGGGWDRDSIYAICVQTERIANSLEKIAEAIREKKA